MYYNFFNYFKSFFIVILLFIGNFNVSANEFGFFGAPLPSISANINGTPKKYFADVFDSQILGSLSVFNITHGHVQTYKNGAGNIYLAKLYYTICPSNYTITYNGNTSDGGSTASTSGPLPLTIANNGFTKTDYTFNGWNTASDGTGISYAAGDNYNTSSDLTLYAQWVLTCSEVSDAGTISGAESSCGSFDPTIITSSSSPNGSNGTLTYV